MAVISKYWVLLILMFSSDVLGDEKALLAEKEYLGTIADKLTVSVSLHRVVFGKVINEHGETVRIYQLLKQCEQEGVASLILIDPNEWVTIVNDKLNEALSEEEKFEDLKLSLDERIAFIAGFQSEIMTYGDSIILSHNALMTYLVAYTGKEREAFEQGICNEVLNRAGELLKNKEAD